MYIGTIKITSNVVHTMNIHSIFAAAYLIEDRPKIVPCFVGLGGEVLMGRVLESKPGSWVNKTVAYVEMPDPEDGWRPVYQSVSGEFIFVDHENGNAFNVTLGSCLTRVSYPPTHADVLSMIT